MVVFHDLRFFHPPTIFSETCNYVANVLQVQFSSSKGAANGCKRGHLLLFSGYFLVLGERFTVARLALSHFFCIPAGTIMDKGNEKGSTEPEAVCFSTSITTSLITCGSFDPPRDPKRKKKKPSRLLDNSSFINYPINCFSDSDVYVTCEHFHISLSRRSWFSIGFFINIFCSSNERVHTFLL